MEYKKCAILLTENCNAQCKMCCDSRGRVQGKTLTIEELDLILNNVKKCNSISHIGITGGEPMLYPGLVDHIINYDYGRYVGISIKTNGYWGHNIQKARMFIEKAKKRLSMISFSYDEFHKEFIKLNYILNIVRIANDLEVPTEIVGCFLKTGLQPGDILYQLNDCLYKTAFKYQPVINTGAADSFAASELVKDFDLKKHNARCIGLAECQLLINPKLNVYPCCSQVIENTILCFGNLNNSSLDSIITDIRHNNVLNTFFLNGFKPFVDLLQREGIAYPEKLTSPCELCGHLFSDDWFLKKLYEMNYYGNI